MDIMLGAEHVPSMRRTRGSLLQVIFPLVTDDTKEMQSSKVEQALWKIFSDWNKIEANFKSLYLELDGTARLETKYRNSVTLVMGEMQEAIKDTDNRVLLLQASLGVPVDDPEGDPMSIWEAIIGLQASGLKKTSSRDEVLLYIKTLKKNLPNWATTLTYMSASIWTPS
jgi:hypothetical protein